MQIDKIAGYVCEGCGRLTTDPERDMTQLREAGKVSCSPERKMLPVHVGSAPREQVLEDEIVKHANKTVTLGNQNYKAILLEDVLSVVRALSSQPVAVHIANAGKMVADGSVSTKSLHVNGGAFRRLTQSEWRELGGNSNPLCDWHEGIGYVIYDDQAHQEYLKKTNALPASPGASECEICNGTGRVGPYFPGGLSTGCGNCSPTPQKDGAK